MEIKQILVPTDFSEVAANAFKFGKALLPTGAVLKVIHVYQPQIDPSYAYTGQGNALFYEQRKTMLDEFVKTNIGKKSSVKIEGEVSIGFPTDVIVEATKEAIDLVVIGSTGKNGLLNKAFGNVSSHVGQKAHCPVLIVPQEARFKKFNNILFAIHKDSAKEPILQQVIDFGKQYNSKIHFIHVNDAKHSEDLNVNLENHLYNFLFKSKEPDFEYNMATIDAETITEGLNQYIEENKIDLTFLVTHHRNFWEQLFHHSITKDMTIHTHIPIMILHDE